MALLLCFSLEEEPTDELESPLWLLEEFPDFTELELLVSDESFVSFAELLEPFDSVLPLLEIASSLPLERESLDSSRLSPLRMTLLSSPPADEESSQAERAKIAANKKMVRDCFP